MPEYTMSSKSRRTVEQSSRGAAGGTQSPVAGAHGVRGPAQEVPPVTEFDPEATTELNNADAPRFPVVMRGYDRWQVDTRFAELAIQLERERQRADEVEARLVDARGELDAVHNQPPPSFQHLGAEAAKLLEQAGESADRLLAEARDRAEAISAEAEQRAQTIVVEAERRSEELERNSSS